jgi:hypothetical protein
MQHTRRCRVDKSTVKDEIDQSVKNKSPKKRGKGTHITFELLSMLSIAIALVATVFIIVMSSQRVR